MAITSWRFRTMVFTRHPISKALAGAARLTPGIYLLLIAMLIAVTVASADAEQNQLAVYSSSSVSNDPIYDSVPLVDIWFTLERDQLSFIKLDSSYDGLSGRVFAQATIYGADGLPVDSASTYFSVSVSSEEEARRKDFTLFNRLSLFVSPGIYSARLILIDVVSKKEGEVFLDEIVVEPARPDKLVIGGQSIAYLITRSSVPESGDRMIRSGYRVLVNPLGAFAADDTVCFLYAELYGLAYSEQEPSKYRLEYKALKPSGALFRDYGHKIRNKPGTSAVVAEKIDISDWPVGRCQIRLVATDLSSGSADTASFQVHVISDFDLALALETGREFDPYDTLSLEVKERLATYLLSPGQQHSLSLLTDVGKARFLDQYWKETDSRPDTRRIENRLEMMKRYEYANRYFSTDLANSNGWSTDRGRVYLVYGPFEEQDDIAAPVIGNAVIVWFYHSLQEGIVFVFEDRQGFHDYTLVHSNADGERFSKEWEARLRGEQYKLDK